MSTLIKNQPTTSNTTTTTTKKIFGSQEKCIVCSKTVYPNERLASDERIFHKACFRCCLCNNNLKLGNYASMESKSYCKVCFKKLFFTKGNYNEGFGKAKIQHEFDAKKSGVSAPTPTPVPVPVNSQPSSAPSPVKSTPAVAASPDHSAPVTQPAATSTTVKKPYIPNTFQGIPKVNAPATTKPVVVNKPTPAPVAAAPAPTPVAEPEPVEEIVEKVEEQLQIEEQPVEEEPVEEPVEENVVVAEPQPVEADA